MNLLEYQLKQAVKCMAMRALKNCFSCHLKKLEFSKVIAYNPHICVI